MNKEQAYDEKISSLISQVVKACVEHGIAVCLDFKIDTPEQPGLRCTTILPDGDGKNCEFHGKFARLMGIKQRDIETTVDADGNSQSVIKAQEPAPKAMMSAAWPFPKNS